MARPLRIEYSGAVYHVTSRGNARNDIYRDERDRANFLDILNEIVKRYNWLCHAYCLMSNHYHLVVETPEANLSSGMRQLNGIYTQRFNKRHGLVGHVYQGRYKAILIDKDNYLLELCRYVVLNPVRANLVELPEHWKWGSYKATVGVSKVSEFLTVDLLLSLFGTDKKIAQQHYRKFVRAGIGKKPPWDELDGQILLGSKGFIKQFEDLLKEKENLIEILRQQRYAGRPDIKEIFAECDNIAKTSRNEKIYEAHIKYGYTLKEVADYFGLHYTTVSKIVRRLL